MNIDDVLKVSPGLVNGNLEGKSARNTEATKTDQQSSEKVTLSARSAELQSLGVKVADSLINTVREMLSGTVQK